LKEARVLLLTEESVEKLLEMAKRKNLTNRIFGGIICLVERKRVTNSTTKCEYEWANWYTS